MGCYAHFIDEETEALWLVTELLCVKVRIQVQVSRASAPWLFPPPHTDAHLQSPQLSLLPTPSPQFPPGLRGDIDSCSIGVRRCLSDPTVNAEGFLNGKLQGVRPVLRSFAGERAWMCTQPEPAPFSKDLTLQHSSRAPQSSLCHQIKFGNFNKKVLKETVN